MTQPHIRLTPLAGRPEQPLLLLGPSMGTSGQRLWAAAARLLDGVHAVAWDLPGHGGAPVHHDEFSLEELADGVLATVDAELSAPTFHHAGDSIGGAVGLMLTLRHPARVATVTLACSGSSFGQAQAWLDRAQLVRREGIAPVLASTPGRWFGQRAAQWPQTRRDDALADLASVDVESYARLCEALAGYDVSDRLAEVGSPLLALAGEDDVVSPPHGMRQLAQQVDDGQLRVLPGVGHLAPLENPAATAAALREHIGA